MKKLLCIVLLGLSAISATVFAQNNDSKYKFRYRYNYEGVQEKQPGTIEQVRPGTRVPLALGTTQVGKKFGKYTYCGLGCGGQQTPFNRPGEGWFVKCPDNTKRCEKNGAECFCAVFKSKNGTTKRVFHAKGISNRNGGRVKIPATETGTHEWYAYCVKD